MAASLGSPFSNWNLIGRDFPELFLVSVSAHAISKSIL